MVGYMHISFRRFLFSLFVLIFVIAAPLVVFYTAGYRLNISNQHLQQTGVLAISTFPRGSGIILNGQELAQKTPYVVQRIMPNLHHVTLNKKGYHEWSQSIRVEEGRTSYITARLFSDSEPNLLNAPDSDLALRTRPANQPLITNTNITFLYNGTNVEVRTEADGANQLIALLPQGEYQLLIEDPEYVLLTNNREQTFIVARQGGAVVELPTALVAFDWLENQDLLIWTDGSEVNTYDAQTGDKTFITRSGETITDVAWHPEADSFFVASNSSIQAYDREVYETREVIELLQGATIADIWLDAAGKNLYYLDTPFTVSQDETIFVHVLKLTL